MDIESWFDIIQIISIDIILGGDNAIVVALACRNLPQHLRYKAMVFGVMLAVAVRIIMTITAMHILSLPFVMGIGGLLLLIIAWKLTASESDNLDIKSAPTLTGAIQTILLADIVMGFDNVLAIAGAAKGESYLVFIGLIVSVPIIIWGSRIILLVINKYPIIIYLGAALLYYTGAGMLLQEQLIYEALLSTGLPLFYFQPLLVAVALLVTFLKSNYTYKKA
ncbi:YjbE family putative metal transport protein [Paenalkalicoccus suaedae]|uniref:YjbE family putative metal transport protein n=1 Tax=Paenalkalicoccus suaedae TaxID=2592382 RepID=A0A859FGI7_9BACI|nr:YjbE family putative metal transport protein [Paenalkalicoccus suaedae]QKS71764.1 YjbE family putative metal transport protein [Paenalkalicoccus suaedae]